MKIVNCSLCDTSFDLHSREKRQAGGIASHCPCCAEETVVKYAGVAAGEGKQGAVQVLKFSSVEDRKNYLSYWQANSGFHKGKSCQLGWGTKSTPGIKFQTVATFTGNTNHKGKA
jgi:hypothetical protein